MTYWADNVWDRQYPHVVGPEIDIGKGPSGRDRHLRIVEIQRVGIEGPNKLQPFRYIRSRTAQPATNQCWLTVCGDALLPV